MKGLSLTRRIGETVEIDSGEIVVTVVDLKNGSVRLNFDAPPEIEIWRGEIADEKRAEAMNEAYRLREAIRAKRLAESRRMAVDPLF